MSILRYCFTSPKINIVDAPAGGESELSGYIVSNTPSGAFAGKEDCVAVFIGADWKFLTPYEGLTIDVKEKDSLYRFDGENWIANGGAGIATKKDDIVPVTGTTVELTYVPQGDVGELEFGYLDSQNNFISLNEFEKVDTADISAKTITIKKDYNNIHGDGVVCRCSYIYNNKGVTAPYVAPTYADSITESTTLDNVSIALASGTGTLEFNNLNLNEDLVTQSITAVLMFNAVALGAITATVGYIGSKFRFTQDGVDYVGTMADGDVTLIDESTL